ncbi:MAG: (4Fe-4S)-binding protein [Thermodesulfobacteriota bacterium]
MAMKELVVISGKEGAGKTTLVAAFASLTEKEVICDADAGLPGLQQMMSPLVTECHRFNWGNGAETDNSRCAQCGLCRSLYPEKEIESPSNTSGEWFVSETRFGPMVHASLEPGAENSGGLVDLIRQEGKKCAEAKGFDLLLTDGPSGLGRPVMASIRGATAALILADPTVSGKHYVERLADLVAFFHVPAMVCVNRFDVDPENTRDIELYAEQRNMSVVGRIPFDPVFAEATAAGKRIAGFDGDSKGMKAVLRAWRRVVLELQLLHGNYLRDWFNGEICHRLDSVGIRLNY